METNYKSSVCTLKSVTKFCLLYFTTLLVLTLIFTALNNEPMEDSQTTWWWAFIGSILLTAAMTTTALIILTCTDYKNPTEADIEQTKEIKSPADSQSTSFKTVLTINSTPDQSAKNLPLKAPITEQENQELLRQAASSFINLTPDQKKNPVTVVDIPAANAQKRFLKKKFNKDNFKEDANLAAIPSNNANEASTKKDKKKKNKKDRKRKR